MEARCGELGQLMVYIEAANLFRTLTDHTVLHT